FRSQDAVRFSRRICPRSSPMSGAHTHPHPSERLRHYPPRSERRATRGKLRQIGSLTNPRRRSSGSSPLYWRQSAPVLVAVVREAAVPERAMGQVALRAFPTAAALEKEAGERTAPIPCLPNPPGASGGAFCAAAIARVSSSEWAQVAQRAEEMAAARFAPPVRSFRHSPSLRRVFESRFCTRRG